MIGIITLLVALGAQIGLFVYQMVTKNRQTKLKHMIRLSAFGLFSLLVVLGVYWWGFRWMGLFILLTVWAILSVTYFVKKTKMEKPYKRSGVIFSFINGCFLLTFLILPGIIFPQLKAVAPTGAFSVGTESITYVDSSRVEAFSETGENRKLTVQFWYPDVQTDLDTYPLVVFSHGSFGYRGSNLSTFENLASNGYVVCSIDHSYHAFYSKHTDGSVALVNMDFLNNAVNIENGQYDAQTTYNITHEWLDLRAADMNFVLAEILSNARANNPQGVYSLINTEEIGLFGHSLGGATAAKLGRERKDIDAVIVVDGTMLGEEVGFENGHAVLNSDAYPVPILNLYNQAHYDDASRLGTEYDNLAASANAVESYDVVIRGSGHLNFTDLPLFSPTLARMLGTGEADSRYCIETMNWAVLEFFNHTLKDTGDLHLKTEY